MSQWAGLQSEKMADHKTVTAIVDYVAKKFPDKDGFFRSALFNCIDSFVGKSEFYGKWSKIGCDRQLLGDFLLGSAP